MNCPRCLGSACCKDGIVKGRQRYKCKVGTCGYRYTVMTRSGVKSAEVKRMAMIMYLGGATYREIEKELSMRYSTVAGWVEEMGEKFSLIRASKKVFSIANADAQISLLEEKGNKEDKFMLLEIRSSLAFP